MLGAWVRGGGSLVVSLVLCTKMGKARVSHRVMILGNDWVIDLRNVFQIFPCVVMFGSVLKMDSVHDFLFLSL